MPPEKNREAFRALIIWDWLLDVVKNIGSGKDSYVLELTFDPQELVVLADAVGAAE